MSYLLINLSENMTYRCSDAFWKKVLTSAENNGWESIGTIYDLIYMVEEECDKSLDLLITHFTVITLRNRQFEWDGNYMDKRNQIVVDEDAAALSCALTGTTDESLINFLDKGAFRISSL